MELIHIANATFSSLSFKTKHSLENLASKQKLSGLLKSRRCAGQRRLTTRQVARSRQHMLEPVRSRQFGRSSLLVRMSSRHHAPLVQAGGELVEPAGIEPATSWLQT